MKSIKEVSELCAMSKTSVNRAIKELGIETTMLKNKNMVSEEDADRISKFLRGDGLNCEEINPNQSKTEPKAEQINPNPSDFVNSDSSVQDKNDNWIIDFLKNQIEEKDKQIARLQDANNLLVQENAFVLKQLETLQLTSKEQEKDNIQPIVETVEQSKKRWWQFWK